MAEILSLNPDLNALLTRQRDDLGFDLTRSTRHFCTLLRACRTDAETALVLRTRTKKFLDVARKGSASSAWILLDKVFDCIELRALPRVHEEEQKPSNNKETPSTECGKEEPRSNNDGTLSEVLFSAMEEHIKYQEDAILEHKRRGFNHVPPGMHSFFDELKKDGYKHDIQSDLDRHLDRLLPNYVTMPQPRAPASKEITLKLVRSIMKGLLDIWREKTLGQEELLDCVHAAGLLDDAFYKSDEEELAARSVLLHYLDHVRSLNLLGFDALYLRPDQFMNSLVHEYLALPFHKHITKWALGSEHDNTFLFPLQAENEKIAAERPNTDQSLGRLDWYPPLTTGLEITKELLVLLALTEATIGPQADASSVAFMASYALSLNPPLLIPQLRYELTMEWIDDSESIFRRHAYPRVEMKRVKTETTAAEASTIALKSYVCGGDLDERPKELDQLLEAACIKLRPPRTSELCRNIVQFEDSISTDWAFHDGSTMYEAIVNYDFYGDVRDELFRKIRNAPNDGQRIEFSQSPGLTIPDEFITFTLFYKTQYIEEERPPAIFRIAIAFYDEYFNSFSDKYRHKNYLLAIEACIDEGLHVTAMHMLHYFLVTCATPAIGYSTPPLSMSRSQECDTFGIVQQVAEIIMRLVGRVPLTTLVDALTMSVELHSIFNENDVDDYYKEQFTFIREMLAEQYLRRPSNSELRKTAYIRLYESRLNEITKGDSTSWPKILLERVKSIELEHDFNIGRDTIARIDGKQDFAWAVSYFKIMESLFRWKFEFLFLDRYRLWLEQTNPKKQIGSRFEQALVRRLLESAKRRGAKYEDLIRELRRRGVEFPDVVGFFREYMEHASFRNDQAHGTGTLRDAEMLRHWVLKSLSHAIKVLGIQEHEFEQVLSC